jgi:hypothetical protein
MKLRTLVAVMVLAAVTASAALAAAPSGKGKPPTTGPGCKPAVAVILTGTLAANGAAAPSTLSVTVTGGNHFAAAYKKATQPVSVSITSTTRINRQGDHNPADLKSGDRVNVHARTCEADLANGATPALTATRVTAHPAS